MTYEIKEVKVKLVVGEEPEDGVAVSVFEGVEPDSSEQGVYIELIPLPDDICDTCTGDA